MIMAVGRSGLASWGVSEVRVLVGRRLRVVDGTLSVEEVVMVLFALCFGPTYQWHIRCNTHNSGSYYSTSRPY